jgi:glycosyltransferase involved in cell wall biosynthesis
MTALDLVSVVIPAYNAAATIDATIRSVRAQTHSRLEILIVDDGSSDATPEIVQSHIAADSRVRLLRQANSGVACARNRGWSEAKAELVAFVDADDLWAADKIEKQLAALSRAGESAALVYTWYAVIDEADAIIDDRHSPTANGQVLEELLMANFVGNGSSVLIRRAVLAALGGYDFSLRARHAEGCEDLLLYLRIAERYEFALVPERLTGYRQTPANMSSDPTRMLRSWRLVAAEMRSRHPQHRRAVEQGVTFYVAWLLARAIRSRRASHVARLGWTLLIRRPDLAAHALLLETSRGLLRKFRRRLRAKKTKLDSSVPESLRFAIGIPDGGHDAG